MRVLSLVNHKGGVGKTTSAVNLAAALALRGRRTLLIDFDSQASATVHLGFRPGALERMVLDALTGEAPLEEVILETGTPGLDLVPADERLSQANVTLAAEVGRETKLKRRLKVLNRPYDFVLIDCPPSLSLLTINAIVASSHALIPVSPDFLSLKGLAQLEEILARVREGLEVELEVLAIVPTIVDHRKATTREALELLRQNFHDLVSETEIRINVRLEEAPSHGQTIFEYAPKSVGAACYHRLAEEVLARCHAN